MTDREDYCLSTAKGNVKFEGLTRKLLYAELIKLLYAELIKLLYAELIKLLYADLTTGITIPQQNGSRSDKHR